MEGMRSARETYVGGVDTKHQTLFTETRRKVGQPKAASGAITVN